MTSSCRNEKWEKAPLRFLTRVTVRIKGFLNEHTVHTHITSMLLGLLCFLLQCGRLKLGGVLWCNIPWASDCHQGGPPMVGRRADLTLCVMALRARSPGRPLCPFNGTHSEVEICWHWCRKHGHKNMRPSLKRQRVLLMTKLKEEARLRCSLGKLVEMRWVLSRELGLSVLVSPCLIQHFLNWSWQCSPLMFSLWSLCSP